VALVVVFALIRPAVKAATAPPVTARTRRSGGQLDAVVADDETAAGELEGANGLCRRWKSPRSTPSWKAARALAKENPAAVANIVRGWVSGESA
jgi:flagellar M-ring protein FliF